MLPQVFKSLNRIVPVAGVRYRLIDEISRLTQGLVNNRLVTSGSNDESIESLYAITSRVGWKNGAFQKSVSPPERPSRIW